MTEITEKNDAQTLLGKMGVTIRNSVTLTVNGAELVFNLDPAAYDAMLNQMTMENKVTPVKDYLLAIVAPKSREDLLQIINIPGLALQLSEAVNAALIPEIKITVKK